MNVLVVDDSPVMRKIVVRTLRQAGFGGHSIVEAGDGDEALEEIGKDAPDVILSDWNMPNKTGIELLVAVRERGLEVPFFFVTSESTQEMRSRASEAGSTSFITKPFTPDDFRTVLEPYLA